jgi:hypothetical protein
MENDYAKYKEPLKILVDQYMWIKALKRSVDVLFSNPKNIERMERLAREFFLQINTMMIHQLILSYCKITDPSTKMGTNLTIDYFTSIDGCDICKNETIKRALENIISFRQYIVPARNKIIAHNDYKTYISFKEIGGFPEGKDDEFIIQIELILNELGKIINGSIYGDFVEVLAGDVYDFVKALRYASGMKEMFEQERDSDIFNKIVSYIGVGKK